MDNTNIRSSISTNNDESNTNDNELTSRKDDKKLADQLSVNSEISKETIEDPNDPKCWPRKKKNFILFITSLAGMVAPLSSTIFYPSIIIIENDFKTSGVLANGIIGVYILFMGVAPLGWAAYSDAFYTRRNVYLASFTIYIIGTVICGLSNSIWLLLAMRLVQACGASAVLSIGAGTISDVFHSLERGRAYGIFYLGPLVGPVIGPVIGGYVTDYLGWRWILWILAVIGGLILILIFFTFPETYLPPTNLPNPNNTTSNSQRRKRFDPTSPLRLLKYPNMSLVIVYISITFAVIYLQNTLVGPSFANIYHVSASTVGLIFLAPGTGYMIGSVIGGKWSDYVLIEAKKRNNGVGYPEMRLHSVWIGCFFISVSYICYGWFLEARLHIALPIIAMFTGGFSLVTVYNSVSTYLVDAFPGRSASAIAINNLTRSLAAALFTFVSVPFEKAVVTKENIGEKRSIPGLMMLIPLELDSVFV
ncbi:14263_t:CDS:2 [Rhizophagus irregularis]|nr:14263_t:CDS:2 [Rhizophagus irregularis]